MVLTRATLLLLVLLLTACGDPAAGGSTRSLEDGAHIKVRLTDLDEAGLLGRTVADGQEVVIPWAELEIGVHEIPFQAEGLGPQDTVNVHVSAKHQLKPGCDGQGWGTVQAENPSDFMAYRCPVDKGVVEVPLTLPPGATLAVDPGWVEGGSAFFPAAEGATEIALSTKGSIGAGPAKPSKATITLTYAGGNAWTQEVEVTHRDSPLGAWIASAPASVAALGRTPAPRRRTALFESGGYFWVEGEADGKTVRDVDLVVKVVASAEPREFRTCNFRTLDGANVSAKTVAVDQTFVAYDVAGAEVARTTLKVTGCPGNATVEKGKTLTAVPGNAQVRAWVTTLL